MSTNLLYINKIHDEQKSYVSFLPSLLQIHFPFISHLFTINLPRLGLELSQKKIQEAIAFL